MRWFTEEKQFDGTWAPAVYFSKEPPSDKGYGRRTTFRAPPVPVKPEHYDLGLDQLNEIYGVKEAIDIPPRLFEF